MSAASTLPPDLTGAMSVRGFCARYGVSRATFYRLAKAKAIRPRKAGFKTIVSVAEAERWLASLPAMRTRRARA